MSFYKQQQNGLISFNDINSQFVSDLGKALMQLIAFVRGPVLREHPKWGSLLPYDVPVYGDGESSGYIIRPDLVQTDKGPQICELDFVPSGRGFLLNTLPGNEERMRFLRAFDKWYGRLGQSEIAFATATTTICWDETVAFANAYNGVGKGRTMQAVNIDQWGNTNPNGVLIDRLFYRSEMQKPGAGDDNRIINKEPYLDSKLVMAVVHDRDIEHLLIEHLGMETMLFLRRVIIETYSVTWMQKEQPITVRQIVGDWRDWVVKNADVETDTCWGSRGVMLGCRESQKNFRRGITEDHEPRKPLGQNPVLQPFRLSRDFTPIWDTLPHDKGNAQRHTFARIGFYILIANEAKKVTVPPFGIMTLRQDPLAHGASDAIYSAFQI